MGIKTVLFTIIVLRPERRCVARPVYFKNLRMRNTRKCGRAVFRVCLLNMTLIPEYQTLFNKQ